MEVITVIPIETDEAARKFAEAERLLREVAGDSINLETFTYFRDQPIHIGNVQFLDLRPGRCLK